MVGSGVVKVMTWGASVLGVSDSQLENMIKIGPKSLNTARGGVQDFKFAAAADFKNFGGHPAYDAHIKPLAAWSIALRHAQFPENPLVSKLALENAFDAQLGF